MFDDPHIDEITADDLLGEYPAVLYRMKKGTVRPKDHVDADRIARRFDLEKTT